MCVHREVGYRHLLRQDREVECGNLALPLARQNTSEIKKLVSWGSGPSQPQRITSGLEIKRRQESKQTGRKTTTAGEEGSSKFEI